MSFYFSSIAPVLNSTLKTYISHAVKFYSSEEFKTFAIDALIVVLMLAIFYFQLVVDIVRFCYALAVNCFCFILDCQPLPDVQEKEIDETIYLPLPAPIAGLLMPASDSPRPTLIASPVILPSEDRVLYTPVATESVIEIVEVVKDKCVTFAYHGITYRAILERTEGMAFLKFQSKGTKRFMPIRFPGNAFGSDYASISDELFSLV